MTYFAGSSSVPFNNTLRLLDADGSNWIGLRSTSSVGSNITLTLPNVTGTNGQVMTTDGSGGLTWENATVSSLSSNVITESGNGNIKFSTLFGSANIHTDGANTIVLSVGSNTITQSGSNLTISMATGSTGTTSGALVVSGGIGVGQDLRTSGNIAVGARLISAIDNFIELNTTQELWSGSNTASMKQLVISNTWTSNFTCTTVQPSGTLLDIFFTGNAAGATANINFGASNLYIGSGVAQYLVFDTKGQSASLVYITNTDTTLNGWRIRSTGGQVY